MDVGRIDALLAALLRGEAAAWPAAADSEVVLRRVRYHGVAALLHERLRGGTDWPAELVRAVREDTRHAAMWELRHQQVLGALLGALAGRGVRPLLFKGTALAYGLYGNPVWRMRCDTDLLVMPEEAEEARQVLAALGYRKDLGTSRELVIHEESWTLDSPAGGSHAIDLHRRLNNSDLLANLFPHEAFDAAKRSTPELGPSAFSFGPVHALLVAAVHRALHRECSDRLIWVYDIHLLAQDFDRDHWQLFTKLAIDKGLRAVCLDSLVLARERFGTTCPDPVLAALSEPVGTEPATAYLRASYLQQTVMNFRAAGGPWRKLVYLFALGVPPAVYVRWKYREATWSWLPWLYVRHSVEGVRKRL